MIDSTRNHTEPGETLPIFIAKLLGEPKNDTKHQLAGNLAFLFRSEFDERGIDRNLIDLVVGSTGDGHYHGWCLILLYNGKEILRRYVSHNRDAMVEGLLAVSARIIMNMVEAARGGN